ncbi:hypothetical protein, partial [Pseudomonas syringae group genomosp. 7]|uniref:hypothetical protein n=1 Tax=Pseudomonas syringae group genomosp. 7 TaxID=251699 RepID=UPI0037703F78
MWLLSWLSFGWVFLLLLLFCGLFFCWLFLVCCGVGFWLCCCWFFVVCLVGWCFGWVGLVVFVLCCWVCAVGGWGVALGAVCGVVLFVFVGVVLVLFVFFLVFWLVLFLVFCLLLVGLGVVVGVFVVGWLVVLLV